MPPWEIPLQTVCTCLTGSPDDSPVPFLVVGSVASELQGCSIGTRDLDVLFLSEGDLMQYTARISRYLHQPETAVLCQKFEGGFEWYKAQHEIGGFLVDAVYIASGGGIPDSITGQGAWEGGPYAWRFARDVQFHKYIVKAAPLAIQLESQIRRGRIDRSNLIAARMRATGYDPVLLEQCLSRDNYFQWAEALIQPCS